MNIEVTEKEFDILLIGLSNNVRDLEGMMRDRPSGLNPGSLREVLFERKALLTRLRNRDLGEMVQIKRTTIQGIVGRWEGLGDQGREPAPWQIDELRATLGETTSPP